MKEKKEIKAVATLNVFETNSGKGARITIPKDIVKALNIKLKDVFNQILIEDHIEMEKRIIIDNEKLCAEDIPHVSINQFQTSTSTQTTTVILADIVRALALENKEKMIFKVEGKRIIIKKF